MSEFSHPLERWASARGIQIEFTLEPVKETILERRPDESRPRVQYTANATLSVGSAEYAKTFYLTSKTDDVRDRAKADLYGMAYKDLRVGHE